MDTRTSAKEAVYCDLCDMALIQMHYDNCLINLCTACVGKNLIMDESRTHHMIKFQSRKSGQHSNKCPYHFDKNCDFFCKLCQSPVCSSCIASGCHFNHSVVHIQQILEIRKKKAARDHNLLKSIILPSYQSMAQKLQNDLGNVESEYEKVIRAIVRHGEFKHSEIKNIVSKLKERVETNRKQQVQTLQKLITEINGKISRVGEVIVYTRAVLDSQSLNMVSSYESRCSEFKMLPHRVNVKVPQFKCRNIPEMVQDAMFWSDSLSVENVQTEVMYREMPAALYSSPLKELMEKPEIVRTIPTYDPARLYTCSLVCLGKETVFVSAYSFIKEIISLTESVDKPSLFEINPISYTTYTDNDKKIMDFFIGFGSQERRIFHIDKCDYIMKTTSTRTKVGSMEKTVEPWDIAINSDGYLLYTDRNTQTINLMNKGMNYGEPDRVLLTLDNWRPLNLCCTLYGDLLVIMDSCDQKQTRVVRYSGTEEKQSIQFDEKGQPLFHSYDGYKCIAENKNLDICVVDCQAGAVVVLDQAGKLRLRYTGGMTAPKNRLFCPLGLTTDSQCQILISDISNDCIHVIDQDGQFLRYIDCGLKCPWGLCTDMDDNLYVIEKSGCLQKIKYLSN